MVAQSRAQLSRWPLPLDARFLKSSLSYTEAPPPDKPEFVFLGRSNVGKSSFLNFLTGRKHLAHASARPGKTRTINHFEVSQKWYFTDVPGYGYARAGQKEREAWQSHLNAYLRHRPNLALVCLLVDVSVPWQRSDLAVMQNLEQSGLPWVLIFTKCDKLPRSSARHIVQKRRQELGHFLEKVPVVLSVSILERSGRDAVLDIFQQTAEAWITGRETCL